jgi:hypothetical protein
MAKQLSPASRPSSPRNSTETISKAALKQWLLIILAFFIGHFHGRSEPRAGDLSATEDASTASSAKQQEADDVDDGWTTIQVFRGINNSSRPTSNRWHSQARQDELVVALLRNKTDGYFVDLAANDAMHLSNTYSLERDWAWRGVCIEPNPIYWYNLSAYRSCTKIAAVVGNTSMEGLSSIHERAYACNFFVLVLHVKLTHLCPSFAAHTEVYFRFEAGDHGGIAGDGFDNGRRWQAKSERRYTVTLQEILEHRAHAPAVMDYLSLDVEGIR